MPRGVVRLFAFASAAVCCAALPARATTIIDFAQTNQYVGTISYLGGANPLVGSGIEIDTVSGSNTPSNAGTHSVTGGVLTFNTGNLTSFNGNTYYFGGGSFQITGGVPDASIGSGTVLLNGTVSATVTFTNGSGSVTFSTTQPDTKNASLLAYFGLASNTLFAFGPANTDINSAPTTAGGAFSGSAYSTDVSNNVVPEPGSMLLFGSGLVGLSALVRRRKRS